MKDFIRYIRGTWGELLDSDIFVDAPEVEKIECELERDCLKVFVYLKNAKYLVYSDEVNDYIVQENEGKPITTTYSLDNQLLLELLLWGNSVKKKLNIDNVPLYAVVGNYGNRDCDKYLTHLLHRSEESYAEAEYCRIHDL